MEAVFEVCQAVVHLNGALRVANVENFVLSCNSLDRTDVSCIVIETHLSPGPVPVLVVLGAVQRLVVPAVHRASIVTNPDVVASIDKKQMERSAIEVLHHRCAVFEVPVLDQYRTLTRLLWVSTCLT